METRRSRLTLTHPAQVANQEGKYLAKLFSNHTIAPGSPLDASELAAVPDGVNPFK